MRGFDPLGEFPGHLGLQSMRERAAAVGGTLDIESAPGEGTTRCSVRARVYIWRHTAAERIGPVAADLDASAKWK